MAMCSNVNFPPGCVSKYSVSLATWNDSLFSLIGGISRVLGKPYPPPVGLPQGTSSSPILPNSGPYYMAATILCSPI